MFVSRLIRFIITQLTRPAALKQTLSRTVTRESHKSTTSHSGDPEKQTPTKKHRFIGKHLHVPGSRKEGVSSSIPAKEPQGESTHVKRRNFADVSCARSTANIKWIIHIL